MCVQIGFWVHSHWLGRAAVHSSPSGEEMNAWSFTSPSLYAFVLWCSGTRKPYLLSLCMETEERSAGFINCDSPVEKPEVWVAGCQIPASLWGVHSKN